MHGPSVARWAWLLAAGACQAVSLRGSAAVQAPVVTPPVRPAESSLFSDSDRVTNLPGQPPGVPDSQLYAGYVDVAPSRSLFYTLQTSSQSPLTDPLVLWLNGGPGCSSLGGGWLSEVGPWVPQQDGTLRRNEFAWTRSANLLFVESPAAVGFSLARDDHDLLVGDERTAADLRTFLIRFLERYKGLASAELYIFGESYAGHYIPTLSAAILDGNAGLGPRDAGFLNLKGIGIGNPWTDAGMDNLGAINHWYSHYHISSHSYETIISSCNFSAATPILAAGGARGSVMVTEQSVQAQISRLAATSTSTDGSHKACSDACDAAFGEMGTVDIYDLFSDICPAQTDNQVRALLRQVASTQGPAPGGESKVLARAHVLEAALRAQAPPSSDDGSGFPSQNVCVDEHIMTWLNRPDVRAALHVDPSVGEWAMCTDKLKYSFHDVITSMVPLHRKLMSHTAPPLRVLIYSGDVDGIVPTAGTRAWVESLAWPLAAPWRAWNCSGGGHRGVQTAGYVEVFHTPALAAGLTFATVRGAGHMVPTTQGARAAHLFSHWLSGEPL